ncbi:hypothetical protein EPI10_001015 [Gossypium australe]|uniref:Uncharacterized protein n=1 Tax=Gossypium australe TaxID=47621 RepID=A0A5B6V9R7_9ROSI|nr:hypothetical protein EPI10_001015 [Gossypium australe]
MVQCELSVTKYEYAAEMVSQKKDHCQRFFFGLHRDIQLYLVFHDTTNFDELVDKAKAIEEIVTHKIPAEMLNEVSDRTIHNNGTTPGMERRVHTSLRAGRFASIVSEDILVNVVK